MAHRDYDVSDSNDDIVLRTSGRMSQQAEEAQSKLLRSKTGGEGGLLGSMAYSYGTFGKDTVHGRLFELETFLFILKHQIHVYYLFVLLTSIFWPILGFAVLPVGLYGHRCKSKVMVMFSVFAALGVILGLSIWILPLLAVLFGGGPMQMVQLVEKKELNYLDFVDFSTCKASLLLYVVFVWVYHEVDRDVHQNKVNAVESWKRRRHTDWGMDCKLHAEQRKSIQHLMDVERPRSVNDPLTPIGSEADSNMEDGGLYIEDIVTALEQVPGWKSTLEDVCRSFYHHNDGEETMFEVLSQNQSQSEEIGVWPLDLFLVKNQFETEIDLFTALYVVWRQSLDMVWYIKSSFYQNPTVACACVMIALVRSLMSRFWLWLVLRGNFWPQETAGSMIVFFSVVTTFLAGLLWLSLAVVLVLEYRRTLIQVTILSALADPDARVLYIDYYLNREYGLDDEQIRGVLSVMPILNLKFPSNVAAFWRLREYTTFDRSNERIAIEFILEAIIIWLFLKFVSTFACVSMVDELPAVVAVTLFDLAIFGSLLLYSLHIALQINFCMDKHKQIFVEAKYQVTLTEQNIQHAKGDDKSDKPELLRDMKVARQLLVEYLNMVLEYDRQDKILLGFIVTPGKILSVVASVGGAIGTLLLNMEKKGQMNIPDHHEVFGQGKELLLIIQNTSLAFWSNHFHL